ncbi:MAG TPA: DNA polymerase domain-containing protein [Clostridiaceae bacterium]|nr:DNA polymerase domain-containing protein [Clostridiaceae bacterium]
MDKTVKVNGKELLLTNMDKVLWPQDNYTKGDLVLYYYEISEYLLPHLKDRLFVMNRYPDGIEGESFYQKDCPEYAPEWIKTYPVYSEKKDRNIDYIVCNDVETLVWLVNQGCIEMHPWLSRTAHIEHPDIAVFDLDPMPPLGFDSVISVALLVKEALGEFGLKGYPKTSGSTGMHIYVPIEPKHTFSEVKEFVQFICRMINRVYPDRTTMERLIENREGKVYLDYLQNSGGKTMACQYSVRPHPGAPVSAPLTWDEVQGGKLDPGTFNIKTIKERVEDLGDLFEEVIAKKQDLNKFFAVNPKA